MPFYKSIFCQSGVHEVVLHSLIIFGRADITDVMILKPRCSGSGKVVALWLSSVQELPARRLPEIAN